jgi:hypothetical protein
VSSPFLKPTVLPSAKFIWLSTMLWNIQWIIIIIILTFFLHFSRYLFFSYLPKCISFVFLRATIRHRIKKTFEKQRFSLILNAYLRNLILL